MSARSIGHFTLGIQLVGIQVKVYKAIESSGKETAMRELCSKCLMPSHHHLHCDTHGTIQYSDLVKGVETAAGKYVVITGDDLKALKAAKTDKVEVLQFVNEDEVDSIYFEDYIYYLAPDGKANIGAFATFRDGLNGKLAIGDYVSAGHDHRVAISQFNKALVMRYLRPHKEIRLPNDIPQYDSIPEVGNPQYAELMGMLVKKLTSPFVATQITDEYAVNFRKLVDAKTAGDAFTLPTATTQVQPSDLLAALTASLAAVTSKNPVPATPAVKRTKKKAA